LNSTNISIRMGFLYRESNLGSPKEEARLLTITSRTLS
jgi:hypothetical protein